MTNGFRTVYDFIRAKSALVVTCRNCDHASFFNTRFLKERLGLAGVVSEASFRCRVCGSKNVVLSATSAEAAIERLDPKMHFAGVYQKYLDL